MLWRETEAGLKLDKARELEQRTPYLQAEKARVAVDESWRYAPVAAASMNEG